jgi:hypothetical protein
MTGAIAMSTNKITGLGNPTALQDAATKYYSDISRDTRLAIAGGNMFGNITMTSGGTVKGAVDPTDAQDVATKAYVDNAELLAIAKDISDTAVDVFVYDTSKDSDGGAWRKRTQNTSWYNEALGTSTRGSRKEFPAVAVIVAESTQVTIYDGDDPDMPMWMVFDVGVNKAIGWGSGGTNTTTSCQMLNGVLFVGVKDATNSNPYSGYINFITEQNIQYGSATYELLRSIADRHSSAIPYVLLSTSLRIINPTVNDVAMTVLPNAPIDAATGLPVPTIAVGTAGGVSVIKDDGAVVDITHTASTYKGANNISFNGSQLSYATQQSGSGTTFWRKVFIEVPSADTTAAYASSLAGVTSYDARGTVGNKPALNTNSNLADTTNNIVDSVHDKAFGFSNKLTLLNADKFSGANVPSLLDNSVAYITSDYNTGWMNGDIKLAALSDTDTANAGAELVTNGDFASDSNWTKGSGWTISGGKANHDSTGGNQYFTQTGVITAGKQYVLTFTISNYTSGTLRIYVAAAPIDITEGNQTYTIHFTASSGAEAQFQSATTGPFVGSIDNVSVKLAEQDRSVNGNGLQVLGTVTKTAVATGADLVAYSGWSSSNYLSQPYNSDLDFGTGDFSVMVWLKRNSNSIHHRIWNRSDSTHDHRVEFYADSGATNLVFYTRDNSSATEASAPAGSFPLNVWTHFVGIRQAGTLKIYANGVLVVSLTGTIRDLTSENGASLQIGHAHFDPNKSFDGSISLFRASATVPSPEQIAKIYNDEKHLFQTGAQATLYGTSDAVTALAHDDSTDLLHAGTSAGRSVFQGLRRVENTTTAVGAAISASNNLVVEE